MVKINSLFSVVVSFGLLCISIQSSATETEYRFEGSVTSVDPITGEMFSVGDKVAGTFIYDPTDKPDLDGRDNIGIYSPITLDVTFSVEVNNFTSGHPDDVLIENDVDLDFDGDPDVDTLIIRMTPLVGPLLSGDSFEPWIFQIQLDDPTLKVFSNDALPATLPGLGEFETREGILLYRRPPTACSPCPTIKFTVVVLEPVSQASPEQELIKLVGTVTALNLRTGIENSLDSKLAAAINALDDLNSNNDVAAVNSIQAFINAVEAQRGKSIPEESADALIAGAQAIIEQITGLSSSQ